MNPRDEGAGEMVAENAGLRRLADALTEIVCGPGGLYESLAAKEAEVARLRRIAAALSAGRDTITMAFGGAAGAAIASGNDPAAELIAAGVAQWRDILRALAALSLDPGASGPSAEGEGR